MLVLLFFFIYYSYLPCLRFCPDDLHLHDCVHGYDLRHDYDHDLHHDCVRDLRAHENVNFGMQQFQIN